MAQSDAHAVTDFGQLVPGQSVSDSIRVENAHTINRALRTVGDRGSGTVCLPEGNYYLLPNRIHRGTATLWILNDNLTLWGAGRNDDGNGTGLHTRGEYSVIDGKVVRGDGLRIVGTKGSAPPRQNITLRDFELHGQSGYTGRFGWPADPATGDGWDIPIRALSW